MSKVTEDDMEKWVEGIQDKSYLYTTLTDLVNGDTHIEAFIDDVHHTLHSLDWHEQRRNHPTLAEHHDQKDIELGY